MSKTKKVRASWGEQEMARIATEDWNLYKKQFMPRIDSMLDQAKDPERGKALALRQSAQAVHDAFEGSRSDAAEAMRQAGINPGSAQFKEGLRRFDTAKASTMGASQAQTQQAHESEHATGIQDLIATGRGIHSGAQRGLAMAGTLQNQQAIAQQQARQASQAAWSDAAGTVAGMGVGAYGQKKGWFNPRDAAGAI